MLQRDNARAVQMVSAGRLAGRVGGEKSLRSPPADGKRRQASAPPRLGRPSRPRLRTTTPGRGRGERIIRPKLSGTAATETTSGRRKRASKPEPPGTKAASWTRHGERKSTVIHS